VIYLGRFMKKNDGNMSKDRFVEKFLFITFARRWTARENSTSYEEILAGWVLHWLFTCNYYLVNLWAFQVSQKASMVGSFKKTKAYNLPDLMRKRFVRLFLRIMNLTIFLVDVGWCLKMALFCKVLGHNDEIIMSSCWQLKRLDI